MNILKETEAKISIALAVYNGEKFLPQLLDSLENQILKPTELIVVDDCSTDNSLKIIESFSSSFTKKIYRNETNIGAIRSFKKASALCTGNYIALCDQDDIWLPDKLQLSVQKIKECVDDKPAIIFSDLSVIDEKDEVIYQSFWKLRSTVPEKFTLMDILFGNIVTGCTTLFNKLMLTAFLKMPDKVMMHDHWLALIAYSFGTYAFINKPTVLFRSHSNSVTKKSEASFLENFIKSFKENENYLKENVEQAASFKEIYKDELSKQDLRILDRFTEMENKSFFYKRLLRDSHSFLRRIR